MGLDQQHQYSAQRAAIRYISEKIGCADLALFNWVHLNLSPLQRTP